MINNLIISKAKKSDIYIYITFIFHLYIITYILHYKIITYILQLQYIYIHPFILKV